MTYDFDAKSAELAKMFLAEIHANTSVKEAAFKFDRMIQKFAREAYEAGRKSVLDEHDIREDE